MRYRALGRTGIRVSEVAFGCGPVPALCTAADAASNLLPTIQRALQLGVNWFDTAATYGDGRSEKNLGRTLHELGVSATQTSADGPNLGPVHVATKVRLQGDDLHDIRGAVLRSVEGSLGRLQLPAVTLLQLHNSVTEKRGAQPTSLCPGDLLDAGGVLDAFEELQRAGLVAHLGLTGLGEPRALIEVLCTGRVATVQAPFNVLYPSAGWEESEQRLDDPPEHDLRGLFAACLRYGIGVFAIRVYAGGALLGKPPSAHTRSTKFFPLDLYQRDLQRAAALRQALPAEQSLPEVALRAALSHPAVHSAIVGFATPEDVDAAAAFAARGPLAAWPR